MGNRLSEVGKDITELKTLSGSGVEVVRGELDERLNKAEKRVVDIEEAFAGLKERLEEVRTQLPGLGSNWVTVTKVTEVTAVTVTVT